MLTHHGQEGDLLHLTFRVVSFNTHPGHLTALQHPFYTDNTDVVFRIAGSGTGIATDAPVQVHHHPPTIGVMVMGWINIAFGIIAFRQRKRQWEMPHGQTASVRLCMTGQRPLSSIDSANVRPCCVRLPAVQASLRVAPVLLMVTLLALKDAPPDSA